MRSIGWQEPSWREPAPIATRRPAFRTRGPLFSNQQLAGCVRAELREKISVVRLVVGALSLAKPELFRRRFGCSAPSLPFQFDRSQNRRNHPSPACYRLPDISNVTGATRRRAETYLTGQRLYLSTIEALAMAVDAKDQITHGHIRRVQVYAVELAKRLGVHEERQLRAIETAALLHDMGKLAIPEHILNKPGKLTDAEFDKMKRHADIGADLLSSVRFPYPVVPIVRHHHEAWDGSGYPSGIARTDIPLGARILSVVDCFDAHSDRPYRPRLEKDEAFRIWLNEAAQCTIHSW